MTLNFDSDEQQTHDVKIGTVQPLEKHINVVFQVTAKDAEREIVSRKTGETHRVCDFTVADDTGAITLTLWNEDIDNIELENTYKLANGFANIYRNSLRLAKGKFGTITDDSTEFEEVNEDNNRSSEHVDDPRRRYSPGGGDRGGYGRDRDRGGGGYGGQRRDRDRGGYGSQRRDRGSRY
jgi:replication factor A1